VTDQPQQEPSSSETMDLLRQIELLAKNGYWQLLVNPRDAPSIEALLKNSIIADNLSPLSYGVHLLITDVCPPGKIEPIRKRFKITKPEEDS
jgi:hypothetical protein